MNDFLKHDGIHQILLQKTYYMLILSFISYLLILQLLLLGYHTLRLKDDEVFSHYGFHQSYYTLLAQYQPQLKLLVNELEGFFRRLINLNVLC